MITSDLFSRTHSQGVLRHIHLCTYTSQYKPSWAVEVAVFDQIAINNLCTDLFLIAFNKFVGQKNSIIFVLLGGEGFFPLQFWILGSQGDFRRKLPLILCNIITAAVVCGQFNSVCGLIAN